MTLIYGTLTDVSGAPSGGVFQVRAVDYRETGDAVISTEVKGFAIEDGVLSAEVAPGPAQFLLRVAGVQRVWLGTVPDSSSVGIGSLLEDV